MNVGVENELIFKQSNFIFGITPHTLLNDVGAFYDEKIIQTPDPNDEIYIYVYI